MVRNTSLFRNALILLFYYVQNVYLQDENCTISSTGDKGVWYPEYPENHCPIGKLQYINGGERTRKPLGENKRTSFVCCPHKDQFRETGKRSRAMCDYFTTLSRVLPSYNGVEAGPYEFLHMAALGYNTSGNNVWGCGGSLISETFILTAAHCLYSPNFGKVSLIRMTTLDLKKAPQEGKDFEVLETFAHPGYKRPSHYHDIGLIRTNKIDIFHGRNFPACLHTLHEIPISQFLVTGWGKTDFIGGENSKLLKVSVNLIPHSKCQQRYSTAVGRKLVNGIDNTTQFCAGHPKGNDPCPGDSGGPLQMKILVELRDGKRFDEHFTVVGITSFGKGCGQVDSVGVYTRVSNYIQWIENIVWPL